MSVSPLDTQLLMRGSVSYQTQLHTRAHTHTHTHTKSLAHPEHRSLAHTVLATHQSRQFVRPGSCVSFLVIFFFVSFCLIGCCCFGIDGRGEGGCYPVLFFSLERLVPFPHSPSLFFRCAQRYCVALGKPLLLLLLLPLLKKTRRRHGMSPISQ